MADSLDNALAPFAAYIRGIDNLPERFAELEVAEQRILVLRRALLREVALGLRAEGKKWKEVGDTMGGVTYQRAFQMGRGQ